PFDHASIPATLQRLFDLGPPLTPRIAAAPDLLSALTLDKPENDGPEQVSAAPRSASAEEARGHARRERNRLQRNLRSPVSGLAGAAARTVAQVRGVGSRLVQEDWRRRG
ncbi:MAG: hypothetical protein ACREFQ_21155, partial [Stellaceae bacterium]